MVIVANMAAIFCCWPLTSGSPCIPVGVCVYGGRCVYVHVWVEMGGCVCIYIYTCMCGGGVCGGRSMMCVCEGGGEGSVNREGGVRTNIYRGGDIGGQGGLSPPHFSRWRG